MATEIEQVSSPGFTFDDIVRRISKINFWGNGTYRLSPKTLPRHMIVFILCNAIETAANNQLRLTHITNDTYSLIHNMSLVSSLAINMYIQRGSLPVWNFRRPR